MVQIDGLLDKLQQQKDRSVFICIILVIVVGCFVNGN